MAEFSASPVTNPFATNALNVPAALAAGRGLQAIALANAGLGRATRVSRFPNAILLRLLAGRMFSSIADACLQSAKRRIEAGRWREERAAPGGCVPHASARLRKLARTTAATA